MNKKEKNQSRIDIIKEERIELLMEVRESIKEQNENVLNNANEIISLLEYDDMNIKKYQSLKEAQELINSLTIEIANSNSKEDIEKLRKKLNYYINKIKNEAKKRNIDYNNYYEKVSTIRKDISKYIRFLKKQDQINELEMINNNYELLTDEDKEKLQRQLLTARNYNTRIKKEQENKKEEDIISIQAEEQKEKNIRFNFSKKLRLLDLMDSYSSDEEFISNKIIEFNKRYDLNETYDYNDSIGKNVISFFKNIPIYNTNKKLLKKMYFDYANFYGGDDLGLYIDYTRRNNSIIEGLKGIFKKSSLYNKENIYLDNHNRCVNWILSFVKRKGIQLSYVKAK